MRVHTKRLAGCLLAASAWLAAPLAGAVAGESSASLTGFTITLIDLNPDDATAPAISYRGNSMASWSQRSNGPTPLLDWKAGEATTEVTQMSGAARTEINARDAFSRAEASNDLSQFLAWSTRTLSFELTPWTAIAFSGLAQAQSSAPDSRTTHGRVSMWGSLFDQPSGERRELSAFDLELDSARGGGLEALVGVLQSGETAAYGDFNLRAIAEVNVTPIAEPATWAMLLLGAGLIGWRLQRPGD